MSPDMRSSGEPAQRSSYLASNKNNRFEEVDSGLAVFGAAWLPRHDGTLEPERKHRDLRAVTRVTGQEPLIDRGGMCGQGRSFWNQESLLMFGELWPLSST